MDNIIGTESSVAENDQKANFAMLMQTRLPIYFLPSRKSDLMWKLTYLTHHAMSMWQATVPPDLTSTAGLCLFRRGRQEIRV